MKLSSPWKFHCNNYNLLLKFKNPITPSRFFMKYWNENFEKSTEEILLTFSRSISTINDSESIDYCEVIFKFKVKCCDREFYYPVITYVNNEYSLLRGFFLGFEKRIADIQINDEKINLLSNDIKMSIGKKTAIVLETYNPNSVPFILHQNYKFDDFCLNRLVTLNVNNYTLLRSNQFDVDYCDKNKLMNLLEIKEENLHEFICYETEDMFEVDGTLPLKLV